MEVKFAPICEMFIHSESEMGRNRLKKCATELCIERFAPASAHAKTLGCIAQRTDLPESVRFPLPPLTGLISYYLWKKELNHKLYSVNLSNASRGTLWNTEMQDDLIEAYRLAAIGQILKDLNFPADKNKIISFARQQLSSTADNKDMENREDISSALQNLQDREYKSVSDVTTSLEMVH